jgi:hypothetical protein
VSEVKLYKNRGNLIIQLASDFIIHYIVLPLSKIIIIMAKTDHQSSKTRMKNLTEAFKECKQITGTPVSSTKTDHHDKAEILLKVTLRDNKSINQSINQNSKTFAKSGLVYASSSLLHYKWLPSTN